MNKWIVTGVCALIAASFVVVNAQDGGDAGGGMMQMPAWMQKTQHHKDMAKNAGEFTVETKMWMGAGEPMPGTATATIKPIKNGYYMHETFKMNFMGQPFEGTSITGYDTVRKKHVSLWVDSMSPVPYISYGEEKDGKITYMGKGPNMMGQMEGKKMVVSNITADGWTVDFFDIKADGKEHQSMHMKYTRKKKAE